MKMARELRGLTLRQVEEMTGISNAYICQIEGNKVRKPSLYFLRKLAKLYALKMDVVLEVAYPMHESDDLKLVHTPDAVTRSRFFERVDISPAEEAELVQYLLFIRSRSKGPAIAGGKDVGPEFYKEIERMEADAQERLKERKMPRRGPAVY